MPVDLPEVVVLLFEPNPPKVLDWLLLLFWPKPPKPPPNDMLTLGGCAVRALRPDHRCTKLRVGRWESSRKWSILSRRERMSRNQSHSERVEKTGFDADKSGRGS